METNVISQKIGEIMRLALEISPPDKPMSSVSPPYVSINYSASTAALNVGVYNNTSEAGKEWSVQVGNWEADDYIGRSEWLSVIDSIIKHLAKIRNEQNG